MCLVGASRRPLSVHGQGHQRHRAKAYADQRTCLGDRGERRIERMMSVVGVHIKTADLVAVVDAGDLGIRKAGDAEALDVGATQVGEVLVLA